VNPAPAPSARTRRRVKVALASAWVTACCAVALQFATSAFNTVRANTASETADQLVARLNRELDLETHLVSAAGWTQQTYINPDTEFLNAQATDRYLAWLDGAVRQARAYESQPLSAPTRRAIDLLKNYTSAPAPSDAARRNEMTQIMARLDSMYGEGKYCPKGPDSCRTLDDLAGVMASSRDYDELTAAWVGWHTISRDMRPKYQRFVELVNEGSRDLGYADLGAMWRSGYDMPADAFAAETERLWLQVKPLYDQLHCYARARLQQKYGKDRVPDHKPIPAQLLGNMWAQQWNKIYDDILKPYPSASIESADRELQAQKWDAQRMTRSAESFYTSIGFPKLSDSFWALSMLTRPRDREVECHASAWNMNAPAGDVRIKACLQPTEEDLFAIYHELGHVYYYMAYSKLPALFRSGAQDGFHEAIGDTINLSVTPGYLHSIGLVSAVKPSPEAVINQQMKMAVSKIAFLPFGKLIDEWRWKVFSGEIKPEDYNKAWWQLRRKYQGMSPPVARTEQDFDPGAKYHVPANTPYTRYFLAFILQFQFHKALCEAAGNKGSLNECSIFGSADAGRRFAEMLQRGQSEPWQDTMQKLTGTRQMDARAIIDYFAPLMTWLRKENRKQQCGWE
jgi:peptidyl-dipeptidase A